jgi:hypothetical protein
MADITKYIHAMVPQKREQAAQNAEDVSNILKAISAAEAVAKSTSIGAVKNAAEFEIQKLLLLRGRNPQG